MITVGADTVAVFHIQVRSNQDFLAGLNRLPDGGFELTYRFRYYRDELVGNHSKDKKSWHRMTLKPGESEAEVLHKMRQVVLILGGCADAEVHEFRDGGRGGAGIMEQLAALPQYFHLSAEKAGEA